MSKRCPDPVGPYEIQVMLGVTRERVAQLRRKDEFPKPWWRLATGVVWRDTDIEKWAHTYRPGLPFMHYRP